MTGKGRCTDNVYIERFWRSFKRDEFYNQKRLHQSLDYKTPASIYFEQERKAYGCTDGINKVS